MLKYAVRLEMRNGLKVFTESEWEHTSLVVSMMEREQAEELAAFWLSVAEGDRYYLKIIRVEIVPIQYEEQTPIIYPVMIHNISK